MTLLRALTFTLALATVAARHAHTVDVSFCREIFFRLLYAALSASLEPHAFDLPVTDV